jgi:hypothetical protein
MTVLRRDAIPQAVDQANIFGLKSGKSETAVSEQFKAR